jgi:hypothetical protein
MWGQCGGKSSAVGADAADLNVCCAWGRWVAAGDVHQPQLLC